MIFEQTLLDIKCVFRVSLRFLFEMFFILKTIKRYIIENVYWSSYNVTLFLSDFNETWISPINFEKCPNIKFHKHPSSESRVVPCAQMRGRADKTKLIVAFRNFTNASKNVPVSISYNFTQLNLIIPVNMKQWRYTIWELLFYGSQWRNWCFIWLRSSGLL
jgi:hypothetical protein